MRLSQSLEELGYHQGVTHPQIWRKLHKIAGPVPKDRCGFQLSTVSMISAHIDDIKGGAAEA
eukprot:9037782-Prorocentrum_lima.AAC.1